MSSMEDPLRIHAVGPCSQMMDNRYHEGGLFCWRSRVTTEPECIEASICSPISFQDARDRFCKYFGGNKDPRYPGNSTCVPGSYVANLPGEDLITRNVHGGIVVEPHQMCTGPGGKLKCFGIGLEQSIRSQTPSQLLLHAGLALGGLLIVALLIRYSGIGKSLRKIKVFDTRALDKKKRGR